MIRRYSFVEGDVLLGVGFEVPKVQAISSYLSLFFMPVDHL